MIIYLEGVDGSGKTTLKNKIEERLNQIKSLKGITEVIANGEALIPTKPTDLNRLTDVQLLDQLKRMAEDRTKVYICDRGPLSDIIYRTFDSYDTVISLSDFWQFWLMFNQTFVVVLCDTDRSEELMKARGDDNPIAYTRHQELRYLFKQITPLFGCVNYDLTFTKSTQLNIINLVIALLYQEPIEGGNI